MATVNLMEKRDEPTTQDHARAINTYGAKADERMTSGSIPVSHARHLDVDAVLARSLAKVVSE